MNTMVISIMLFTCLLLLALIALAKPLKAIAKFLFSAAVGGCLLWAGQTLGAAVAVFLHWLYHIPRLCADPGTDCTQPPALWRSWSSAAGKHLAVCFLCRSDGGRF